MLPFSEEKEQKSLQTSETMNWGVHYYGEAKLIDESHAKSGSFKRLNQELKKIGMS
jgi:hypothetical protein